ncbi:MAG: pyridoxal-phosphate-dependent aminotransferase family protein [Tepidisphaerales bacterium]
MLTKYRLYTPGPTSVPEATLAVLARPVHHHRTPEFRATFTSVQKRLQYVFQTRQNVHVITGSGTAAFEAGLSSVFAPGSRVLNISNGKFAERWGQQARTFGLDCTELKLPYGHHVRPEQLRDELGKLRSSGKVDGVLLVHSETSTATVCDLAAVAAAVREAAPEALLVVDGITSIGALPFKMDEWGVDVAVTGSQKALMLPPGLGFVALSERARQRMHARTAAPGGIAGPFYLDLRKSEKSLPDGDTPFTPANTLIEALDVSLQMIEQETLETVWRRTATVAAAFRSAMTAIGLRLFSRQPADSVTAVEYPDGGKGAVSDKAFRGMLKTVHNVHVAGGQGSMEGTLFRVNHMGYTDAYDALAVVAAVEHTLAALQHRFEFGAGVSAAHAALRPLFAAS